MKSKYLWIIGGFFVIILIWQLILITDVVSKASNGIHQKIAGLSISLPQPENQALVRPPEKSSGASNPQIAAKSVILVDVPSSYVMFTKNADEKVPIASTTKIMTAMVVLENYRDKLNDVVTITYPMIAVEGSDIKLTTGEKITVESLLKGLLIMSGNDTAFALATYFGGKDAFVAEMNNKAKDLGLQNTNFRDPAGLDDEGYSNARDLAFLAAYAMRHQKFREIVNTQETTVASVDGRVSHELKTSNHMLKSDDAFYYPSTIGVKTGFTYAAGHCLVSAAEKNNHEILGVVLNTSVDSITASAQESRKLLDWGFANWNWQ